MNWQDNALHGTKILQDLRKTNKMSKIKDNKKPFDFHSSSLNKSRRCALYLCGVIAVALAVFDTAATIAAFPMVYARFW